MHGKEKINMRLKNRSVVVTGASSGMGKAIVELFVKEGANVIAVARRKERLDALAAGVRQLKIHKSSKSGLVAAFFVSSP